MKWLLSASIVLCVIVSSYGQSYSTIGYYNGKLTAITPNVTTIKCAAHLVQENWLVTSAHCVENINSMVVKIGPTMFRGVKAFSNENYLSTSRDNDLALLKITDGIVFNQTVTITQILNCTSAPLLNSAVNVLSLDGTFRKATIMSDYACQWKTFLLYTHVVCLNEVQLLVCI